MSIVLEIDKISKKFGSLIANEAVRIIKNINPDKPLFLYVAFNAPHTPIQAEDEVMESLFSNIEDEYQKKFR